MKNFIKFKKNTQFIPEILEKFYYYNNYVFYLGQIAILNQINILKYIVGLVFIEDNNWTNDYYNLKKQKIKTVITKNNYNYVHTKIKNEMKNIEPKINRSL